MSRFAFLTFLGGMLLCAQDQGEVFMTSSGFLAISTPVGFKQTQGPMEVLFTPEGKAFGKTESFIYVGSVRIGEGTQFPDVKSFIDFDVASFRERFPTGSASPEASVLIKHSQSEVPSWTFRSGEKKNGFERLVFLQDAKHNVWLLVLSAQTEKEFKRRLSVFEQFVQSYKGSIFLGQPK